MAKTSKDVVSVDFTGVESGGGSVKIPEGDYGLKVDHIDHKNAQSSGKPCLYFYMKVTKGDPKGVGKILRHTCSLSKEALWNLRNLLEAMGKEIPAKSIKIPLEKLVGLECAATVVDGEYDGKPKSEISTFFPLADLAAPSPTAKAEKGGKSKAKAKEEEEEDQSEEAEEESESSEDETEELFS